jgi:hypothetical protein
MKHGEAIRTQAAVLSLLALDSCLFATIGTSFLSTAQTPCRRFCRRRSCTPASAATAISEVVGSGTGTGAVARNPEILGMLHENWNAPVESNLEINELELSVPLLT